MNERLKLLSREIELISQIYDSKIKLIMLHDSSIRTIPLTADDVTDKDYYQVACYSSYCSVYKKVLDKINEIPDTESNDVIIITLSRFVYENIVSHKDFLVKFKARASIDGSYIPPERIKEVTPREAFILTEITCYRMLIEKIVRLFDRPATIAKN